MQESNIVSIENRIVMYCDRKPKSIATGPGQGPSGLDANPFARENPRLAVVDRQSRRHALTVPRRRPQFHKLERNLGTLLAVRQKGVSPPALDASQPPSLPSRKPSEFPVYDDLDEPTLAGIPKEVTPPVALL
jgi:hypothetical protein